MDLDNNDNSNPLTKSILDEELEWYNKYILRIFGTLKVIDFIKDVRYTMMFHHETWWITFWLYWSIMAPFAFVYITFGDTKLWDSFLLFFGFSFSGFTFTKRLLI